MRICLAVLCMACFPVTALADAVRTIEVVNDCVATSIRLPWRRREVTAGPR